MTKDEKDELLKDLSSTAYTHLNFSGLWQELSNEEQGTGSRRARREDARVAGAVGRRKVHSTGGRKTEMRCPICKNVNGTRCRICRGQSNAH